jgi:hypothetical protein
MHGRLWDEPGGAAYLARLTSIGEEHAVFDQIGAWASVIGLLALGHSVMFAALSFAPASPLEALSTSLCAFLWTAIGLISTIGAMCSGYIPSLGLFELLGGAGVSVPIVWRAGDSL